MPAVSSWAEEPFGFPVITRWPLPSGVALAALLLVGCLPPQPLLPVAVHLVGSGAEPAAPLKSSDHLSVV